MSGPPPIRWTIAVGADTTIAALEPAPAMSGAPAPVFVCAHGAGGHMGDRAMLALSAALTARGVDVVRFDFLYKAQGSRRPDPMPRLIACFTAVVERARAELGPRRLFIGGRSMGGRAASMMAADGFACDGLLLYAYPLHPAGQPEKLRVAHLPKITVPVLCANGTRDALCTPALMEQALTTVTTRFDMHWLQGADHSFHVLKSSGRTDAAVLGEVAEVTEGFLVSLGALPASPAAADR